MRFLFGKKSKRRSSRSSGLSIRRFLGPGISGAGILAALFGVFTGRIDLSALDKGQADTTEETTTPVNLPTNIGPKSNETIRIATFNIQKFGKKKSANRHDPTTGVDVMGTIAAVVSQFDLVAIQEVLGGDSEPIQRLVNLLNASGGRYTATLSVPIGRTSYKESYAFVWDQSRIQFLSPAYVVRDDTDLMHREPMVATFQTRTAPSDGRRPFRFTLINAHTDPDEVGPKALGNEMNVLDDVFASVRQYEYSQTGEDDYILLGDLNVATDQLGELGSIPNVGPVIRDMPTNTRRTKVYDHILIDWQMTTEFTRKAGVFDLQSQFGLTEQQALSVSDHMPVWAEFSAYEIPLNRQLAEGQRVIR